MKTITGTFTDAQGNPVANGVLRLQLSQDATVSGTAQIAPLEVVISLNGSGQLPASTQLYGNDELTPSGTFYYASVYTALSGGGKVYGPEAYSIIGGSPVNLNAMIPIGTGVVSIPSPVLLSPLNNATQTVSGPLQQNGGDPVVSRTTTDTLSNKTLTGTSSGNAVTLLNVQPAAAALTGNSSDQTLFTFTIPANTLGQGKGLRIRVYWQHNSGVASVTYKIILGAATAYSVSSASTALDHVEVFIFNNSGTQANQQAMGNAFLNNAFAGSTYNNPIAADMTQAQALKATFNVANTDQVTPKMLIIELIQ